MVCRLTNKTVCHALMEINIVKQCDHHEMTLIFCLSLPNYTLLTVGRITDRMQCCVIIVTRVIVIVLRLSHKNHRSHITLLLLLLSHDDSTAILSLFLLSCDDSTSIASFDSTNTQRTLLHHHVAWINVASTCCM